MRCFYKLPKPLYDYYSYIAMVDVDAGRVVYCMCADCQRLRERVEQNQAVGIRKHKE